MITPPWIPSGIKGLRASAATLRDDGMTVALPSHSRFECEFEALYGMRVLQRQSRWYAMLDAVTRTAGLVTASAFVAVFCLGKFDLAVYSGALLMLTLFVRAMILPANQLADSLRLRDAFVAVRSEAARLTDRQYSQRLRELQMRSPVKIWRWLARSACVEICQDLGCSSAVSVRASHRDLPRTPAPEISAASRGERSRAVRAAGPQPRAG